MVKCYVPAPGMVILPSFTAVSNFCQMKKPTCDISTYKNFKISKTYSKSYGINSVFNELGLDEWTNLDTLIMKDTKSLSGAQSTKKYKDSLAKIGKHLNRYPYVKTYADKVNLYLQSADVYKEYVEKFEDHLEKKEKRRSKRKLNNQTQLNSQAEVLLELKKKLRKIQAAITEIDSVSDSSTTSTSLDVAGSVVSGVATTSSASPSFLSQESLYMQAMMLLPALNNSLKN